MGWWKNFLDRLAGKGAPPADKRKTSDRRNEDRRWMGSAGEKPRSLKDPRRKKERRRKPRRKPAPK